MKNSSFSTFIDAEAPLADEAKTLNVRQQIAYALPTAGTAFLLAPAASVLQGVYATYFGLSLTAIAMVFLIARIFDAFTDPITGYLSDRYHARTGSRKVFLACGGILLVVSGYFLYVPIDPSSVDASTQVSTTYFLVFYLLFYLSATIFDIPHLAWGAELTTTSVERNGLFSWRFAMVSVGFLLFYAIPLLPFFESKAITPQTLQWTVLASAFLVLPTLFISLKTMPNQYGERNKTHALRNQTLRLTMLVKNKPLLIFLITFLLTGLFGGMYMTMSFIYVNSYLGLGEHYALATLTLFFVSILSIRFWNLLATRFNKPFAWALGAGLMITSTVTMSLLEPKTATLQHLLLINTLLGCGMAVGNIVAPSILSDVIDYSRWKFNTDCSASFFAAFQLTAKGSGAVGGALALLIAGRYGFDPSSGVHSSAAIFGLRLAAIWLPALIGVASVALILLSPITERRHKIIRSCLALRDNRLNRVKPTRIVSAKTTAEMSLSC